MDVEEDIGLYMSDFRREFEGNPASREFTTRQKRYLYRAVRDAFTAGYLEHQSGSVLAGMILPIRGRVPKVTRTLISREHASTCRMKY